MCNNVIVNICPLDVDVSFVSLSASRTEGVDNEVYLGINKRKVCPRKSRMCTPSVHNSVSWIGPSSILIQYYVQPRYADIYWPGMEPHSPCCLRCLYDPPAHHWGAPRKPIELSLLFTTAFMPPEYTRSRWRPAELSPHHIRLPYCPHPLL